jgi:hypothetical protein
LVFSSGQCLTKQRNLGKVALPVKIFSNSDATLVVGSRWDTLNSELGVWVGTPPNPIKKPLP